MSAAEAVKPEKVGAGLLLCSEGEALVLLRNSKHNHNTWGLPGGNADLKDQGDLKTTAVREALEEMTTLPEYDVVGEVLTKRGKRSQKHYTVYICKLLKDKDAYAPKLNYEHSAWKWMPVEELRARDDLHPVVHLALHDHWEEVAAMVKASSSAGAPG